jgi:hypothetical protein
MNIINNTSPRLIAPCGMNCGICRAFLRDKNKCPSCRGSDKNKSTSCLRCRIMKCTKRTGKYCFACVEYPCKRLKHLDKRYRTKYQMSMIENLDKIKKNGIRVFTKNETKRWTCSKCQGVVCVHGGECLVCGHKYVSKIKFC